MKSCAVIAAIVASSLTTGLAAPSFHSRQVVKQVDIVVQVDKTTSETDLAVVDKETSWVLGHSCSSVLNTGAFSNFFISADLDSTGAGSLTIGPDAYRVHQDPAVSGGISCVRMYNHAEVFVSCNASLPTNFSLSPVPMSAVPNCFSSGRSAPRLQSNMVAIMKNEAPPANLTVAAITERDKAEDMNKRKYECLGWTDTTILVGNGNPHQNYYTNQLSQNMECGTPESCTVGQLQSVSYTIGWTAAATAWEWLTGGFAVSVSWTTGDSYTPTAARRELARPSVCGTTRRLRPTRS